MKRFDAQEFFRVIKSSAEKPRHWVEALQFLSVRVLETICVGYEGKPLR